MERSLEDLVWQRAGGRCEYCQISRDTLDLAFEVDHIIAEHSIIQARPRPGIFAWPVSPVIAIKGRMLPELTRQRERSSRCSILAVTNGHGIFAGTGSSRLRIIASVSWFELCASR